jgi:hypothetical protein
MCLLSHVAGANFFARIDDYDVQSYSPLMVLEILIAKNVVSKIPRNTVGVLRSALV